MQRRKNKQLKNHIEIDIEDNQSLRERIKTYKFKQRLVIDMEMRSGRFKTFIVDASEKTFEFQNGLYNIDSTLMTFNESYKLYSLLYHQDYANPIKRNIPVVDIKDGIKYTEANEVIYSSNPATLLELIRSNIIQSVIRAGDFLKKLETYKLLWFTSAVVSILHLLLFAHHIGLFERLGGVF